MNNLALLLLDDDTSCKLAKYKVSKKEIENYLTENSWLLTNPEGFLVVEVKDISYDFEFKFEYPEIQQHLDLSIK